MRSARKLSPALVALWLGAALGGCGKSFVVRQYPDFYSPDLKTVAVLPFRNETPNAGAGEILAGRLSAVLKSNGTYKILGPRELRQAIAENDSPATTRPDQKALVEKLKKLGTVQAYITGTVLTWSAYRSYYTEWNYPDDYPQYPYYPSGWGHRSHYGYGWGPFPHGPSWDYDWDYPVPYYVFVGRAHVAAQASMIRVSDGSVIYSTPVPADSSVSVSSYSPDRPEYALTDALDRTVWQLVDQFAIVPVKIKVNPDKDLRTARAQRDGLWEFTDSFRTGDERMFVVLNLPMPAARNPFRLTITPKGREKNALAVEDFTWLAEDRGRGFGFSPKKISAGMGPGRYSANFYSGGQLVMTHDFKIE